MFWLWPQLLSQFRPVTGAVLAESMARGELWHLPRVGNWRGAAIETLTFHALCQSMSAWRGIRQLIQGPRVVGWEARRVERMG